MSGKNFLFLSMAALLILLALGQSLSLHYMSMQIADQMEEDTRILSKKLVERITTRALHQWTSKELENEQENFAKSKTAEEDKLSGQKPKETIIIIENEEKCIFGDRGKLLIGSPDVCAKLKIESEINNDKRIELDKAREIHLAKLIKSDLDNVDIRIEQHVNAQHALVEIQQAMGKVPHTQSKASFQLSSKALDLVQSLKNWNMIIVIVFAAVGLIAAYWISHFFSKPLNTLANGYERAGQGELSLRLEPEGVKEVKAVFEGFNTMLAKISDAQQQAEKLKEQTHLAEIGEVARGLAHALRNPIHSLGLNLEKIDDVIQSDKLDYQGRINSVTEKMKTKLDQMDSTIRSLLTLSATDVVRENQIKLFPIVQDILLEVRTGATKDLHFDVSGLDANSTAKGALAEWRSLLHALIVNAIDASPKGGTVFIACVAKNSLLEITVRDEGVGIDEDIRDAIFQPHVSSKAEGSGMGLYITDRLLRLFYNGKIELNNLEQGGCEARITVNQVC